MRRASDFLTDESSFELTKTRVCDVAEIISKEIRKEYLESEKLKQAARLISYSVGAYIALL